MRVLLWLLLADLVLNYEVIALGMMHMLEDYMDPDYPHTIVAVVVFAQLWPGFLAGLWCWRKLLQPFAKQLVT